MGLSRDVRASRAGNNLEAEAKLPVVVSLPLGVTPFPPSRQHDYQPDPLPDREYD